MLSLSDNKQPGVTEAFNSTMICLNDLILIILFFEQMVSQIY